LIFDIQNASKSVRLKQDVDDSNKKSFEFELSEHTKLLLDDGHLFNDASLIPPPCGITVTVSGFIIENLFFSCAVF
jgi:hypothetical protein